MAIFNFVGEVVIPKKRPFVREVNIASSKVPAMSLTLGIKESENNIAYVEAFGAVYSTVKVTDIDGNKLEIPWDDRNNPDVMNRVADYCKRVVDLGERKEFLTEYDMIQYLYTEIPNFNGRAVVTGMYERTPNRGNFYDHYTMRGIYMARDEQKNQLLVRADLYYKKGDADKSSVKDDGKVFLNSYMEQYIRSEGGMKFVPCPTVFNTAVYDMNNPKHKALYDYKMKHIDLTGKNVMHMMWETRLINGAETVEFNESMLTKNQREQIELGIATLKDFERSYKNVFGASVHELRLHRPDVTGVFADGMVEADMTVKEFEEAIFIPQQDVVLTETTSKKEEPAAVDVDEDDLF